MPQELWQQKLSDLLDIPLGPGDHILGQPGNAILVNGTRDGLIWGPGGGGATGPQGPQGIQGPQGPQGVQGLVGPTGLTGGQGPQGIQGPIGAKGDRGVGLIPDSYGNLTDALVASTEAGGVERVYVVNPNGDQRSSYAVPAGLAGDQQRHIIGWTPENGWQDYGFFTGTPGPAGLTGPQGAQGPTGPTGPAGVPGPVGADGADGLQGPQGIQGPAGPQGIPGPTGPAGATQDLTNYLNRTTGGQMVGPLTVTELIETIYNISLSGGVGAYDTVNGNQAAVVSTAATTINVTHAGASSRAKGVTIKVLRSSGAVGALTVNAVSKTIYWLNGTPPAVTNPAPVGEYFLINLLFASTTECVGNWSGPYRA